MKMLNMEVVLVTTRANADFENNKNSDDDDDDDYDDDDDDDDGGGDDGGDDDDDEDDDADDETDDDDDDEDDDDDDDENGDECGEDSVEYIIFVVYIHSVPTATKHLMFCFVATLNPIAPPTNETAPMHDAINLWYSIKDEL